MIAAEHPRQKVLFFIDGDFGESDVSAMRAAVARLASSRSWVLGPPKFVDQVDETQTTSVDKPIRTTGGVFEIYSGLPPWKDQLPRAIDRSHLEELEAVVEAMAGLSADRGLEIAFELDGAQVGWIEGGKVGDYMNQGLLEPWRQELGLG